MLVRQIHYDCTNWPVLPQVGIGLPRLGVRSESFKKKIIFVIDDDQFIHEILKKDFKETEYEIKYFKRAIPLLINLISTKPDLVILDINMPVISGIELAQLIKNMPGLNELPLLAITGKQHLNKKLEKIYLRFDDYEYKPIHKEKLAKKVRRLLYNY